jgi:glycosyltransferase involved in cell wall biosynthesis
VFEVHNADFHYRNKFLSKRWENYAVRISRKNQVIRIITISGALKEFWCNKGIPKTKLLAAHDGFSSRLFKEENGTKETRALLGLPENKKIVSYVGSLYPNRGIERIISLAQKFPEVLFLVIGGLDEQKQYYQDLSNQSNIKNILWKGYLPHSVVPNYLLAANVLLLLFTWDVPTIRSCSPLKVFEYMAAGKPIVGEAFPTITEVLEHNLTAYLAKPDDFDDLCKNLKIALSNNESSIMGLLAREDAFLNYTWENRAKKILTSIDGLIK